jgi:hypothetical protein
LSQGFQRLSKRLEVACPPLVTRAVGMSRRLLWQGPAPPLPENCECRAKACIVRVVPEPGSPKKGASRPAPQALGPSRGRF